MGSGVGPRLAWPLFALAVAGATGIVVLDVLNRAHDDTFGDRQPIGVVVTVSFALLGAIIVSRRPENRIGWIYLAMGLVIPVQGLSAVYYERSVLSGGLPGARWAAWVSDWSSTPVWPAGLALFAFLLYPSGRLPSRRWRPIAWLAIALTTVFTLLSMLDPGTIYVGANLPEVTNPTGVSALGAITTDVVGTVLFLIALGLITAAIGGLVVAARRAPPEERQQVKLLAYAAGLTIATVVAVILVALATGSYAEAWFEAAILLGFGVAVPVACGIAIFKHGLYDIDLVINKTVLVGIMAVFIGVLYALIVAGLGTVVSQRGSPWLSAAAAAVIAIAFQPLRTRAQLVANRVVYGRRATPYEALSELSRGGGSYTGGEGLLRIAQLIVQATGVVQATVWLRFGDVLQPQASWPEEEARAEPVELEAGALEDAVAAADSRSRLFPVEHEGELLGAITVRVSPSEPLTLVDEKLIADLAAQAGLGLQFERTKERALFARALASFLPPEVTAMVEKSPTSLALREEVEATILFSDIRGFSSLAEELTPLETADVVGRHLAAMAGVVTEHGGTLDRFAGDAVMAVFGAPRALDDHARRAVECATAMQRRQADLNEAALASRQPAFEIGIGVNTGTVIAGTLGGAGRLDYTVLGDPVNVAQRLQSEAEGGEIVVSAATVEAAGVTGAEHAGRKHLKGRRELVDTYRIEWQSADRLARNPTG
jgi:class 3 adenylate cyclase